MARAKSRDDRFQPSAETTRIVPMADGWFNVHTPDGKRLRRHRSELASHALLPKPPVIPPPNDPFP